MKWVGLGKVEDKLNGTILVSQNNKIIVSKAYGYADFNAKTPNTIGTNFLLCSISKTFVAIAINQLHEKGLLNKSDLLNQYMPEYFKDKGITIYHLLTHTSGIPNYVMYRKEFEWTKDYSPSSILEAMNQKGLKFVPGKKMNYSNTNFYILAMIIEKVTGEKYEDYIRKNIFEVANMKHTKFVTDKQSKMAVPHNKGQFTYTFAPSLLFGAGDIISNVKDMYQFATAVMEYKLIKKETLDQMIKPALNKSIMQYGEGLFIRRPLDEICIGHSGSIPNGGATQLSIFPESKTIIIVLLNNRIVINPLVYPDANGQYVGGLIAEQVFENKIGFIKKAYL